MRNVIATTFAAAVFSLFAAAACANSEDIGGDTSPTLPEPDGGQPMGDPPTRTDPAGSSGNSGSQSTTTDAGSGSTGKDSGSGGGSTGTDSGSGGSTGTDSGGGGGGTGGPVCDTSSIGHQLQYSGFYSLYGPVLPGCPCDPSSGMCCYDNGKDPPKCVPQ